MVLTLSSLPGMKPTWSFLIRVFIIGVRRLASILANIIRPTLSKEIGRQLVTRLGSFPAFGITEICALVMHVNAWL